MSFSLEGTTVSYTPDNPVERLPISLHPEQVRSYAAYVVFPEFGSAHNQPITRAIWNLWAHVVHGVVDKFKIELTTFRWE